jgi:hypothetical protein
VHDTTAVRVLERTGHVPRDPHGLRDPELSLPLQPSPERSPFHVRHGVPALLGRGPRIEHRQHARVIEPRGELDLTLKSERAERPGQVGIQHLEGNRAVVPEIAGEVDRGHPAAPKLALERVPALQCSADVSGLVGHSSRSKEGILR